MSLLGGKLHRVLNMEHGPAQIDDTENLLSSKKPEYYTMPCLRFTNIVKAFLFLDAVVTCVLWLTGGNTTYFVENIFDFHILESVFDLVLITSVKMLFLCIFYSFLESSSYHLIDKPFDAKLLQRKRRLHALVIIISLICFAYSSVKSGLVLYVIIHRPGYRKMHMTYNVLLISSVTFGLLDMVMSMLSFRAMRRLALTRMLHRFNDKGQEVNADGEPLGKKVNLKRLVSLAKPETGLLSVAFLALLASSITQMVAPLFFGKVVDAALVSMAKLNQTVTILFCIYVGGAIASFFRAWLVTLAGQRLVARLRKDLFSRILKQEISFFDSTRTGELMNRLSSDTQVIQNAVTVNVSMLFRYCLQIIGSLGVMFALNAALTGVLLAVVPVVSFGAVQYGRLVKHLQKNFQDRLADAATRAEESFSNVRTVRAFVAERNMSDDYSKEIGESYEMGKKLAFFQGLFEGVIGVFACGAIVLVLWYGGKLVYQNEVSAGLLTSFLLYTLQVAMAFAFLSSLYGDFMQAVGASVRIFDLLDREPEISLNTGICPSTIDGSVKFGNVRFAYPSRPESEVMQGVSFSVEPGQVVALVGPSGGGKSTVVSLIERFYDPLSGSIFLGGFDLKTLNSNCYHSKISVVNQEPTLFATSIKNNIAFGRDASIEEIVEAAKQANAHDFIMSFQEGYETLVGERGVQLSGGQKQRVAVARALIMNPSLLLLDEATSALDAESEHLVQEAIDRAMVGRTVLIVAHRLSTVRNASQVIVIDRGTIVEQGTHEALLAENGVYKRLVLRQLDVGSHHVPDNDLKQTGF